jgi:hypothetical protein
MITIYSEKKEVRNNAMPSHSNNSVATESVIPGSLKGMSELVKKNLESVKEKWIEQIQQLTGFKYIQDVSAEVSEVKND